MKTYCCNLGCKRHPAHKLRKIMTGGYSGECRVKCFKPADEKKKRRASVDEAGVARVEITGRCERAPKPKKED